MTVDAAGQIYLVGVTFDGLPVTPNAFQHDDPAYYGLFYLNGFLLKLDPSGSKVLYGTYLNGLQPMAVKVDPSGNMYVLADHAEPDWKWAYNAVVSYPATITPGAVQPYPGFLITPTLLKIAPSGELVYSTFLGGREAYAHGAFAVDGRGSAVVCGSTADPAYPVSPGAFQDVLHDSWDIFVTRITPDGTGYEASAILGGDGIEYCSGVQMDSDGNIYVLGTTTSRFFPVTPGAYQTTRGAGFSLFAAKLDPSMRRLLWSTYIGGDWDTLAQRTSKYADPLGAESLLLAADGSLAFIAFTQSSDFPVSPDTGPPPTFRSEEGIFGLLDPTGSRLVFSTPLPGVATSVVTLDGKTFHVLGSIGENFYSTLNAAGLDDAWIENGSYIARIDAPSRSVTYAGPLPHPTVTTGFGVAPDGSLILVCPKRDEFLGALPPLIGGIFSLGYGQVVYSLGLATGKQPSITELVNPASLLPSPITPGQVVELRGKGLAPSSTPVFADAADPPFELAGTRLFIDGQPVPLLSVSDTRLFALAPAGGFSTSTVPLSVEAGGTMGDARTVATAAVNPGLFTTSVTGVGQAISANEDGSANSPQSPALKQHRVRLLTTGLGAMGATGPRAVITAEVAGLPAQVTGVLPAAEYSAGHFFVEVVIPAGAPESDFAPVAVAADGVSSQPGVTICIR